MKKSHIIIGLGVIIFVLLMWGLIGSSKVDEIGITCDFGLGKNGDVFCWKWHQNIIGDIGEMINSIFNN
jgi:hypothetical protein